MQTALKLGRVSAPIIFAMQRDQRLKELLATRLTNKEDVAPGALGCPGGVEDVAVAEVEVP